MTKEKKNGYIKLGSFLRIVIPVTLFLVGAFIATVSAIDNKVDNIGERSAVNQANIVSFQEDILEIKGDIKELLKRK